MGLEKGAKTGQDGPRQAKTGQDRTRQDKTKTRQRQDKTKTGQDKTLVEMEREKVILRRGGGGVCPAIRGIPPPGPKTGPSRTVWISKVGS